ncbi:MAG: uroporphyrinogen decarboxylase family protein, partial [Victivallales bacterium]|nr:uroporphyrinogen decarboxylase family protein [Victivallales bacterium]
HEQPDRVPIDIGGTCLTGMRPGCRDRLMEVLGFTIDPNLHHGIDERLLQWAGTDFRQVGNIVDLPPFEKQITPTESVNCWGIKYVCADGEWQISENPLRGATIDDLKSYPWPEPRVDDRQLAAWIAEAKRLKDEGRYAVAGNHPVFGCLELGFWMCGYDDFFLKMALEPDFVRTFFDKVLEIQNGVIEQYYGALGPYLDLTTSGDDFGTQDGPMISPEMFTELVAPYFAARIRRTKELAHCYYWHHSCGSIFKLLEPIIACGVDILNPIQTSAAGMDPAQLKKHFGDKLVFWGGVDVQQFLPNAAPDEIAPVIHGLIDIMGRDGGYVMAAAHEMQDDIPAENIVAWIEAVRNHKY